MITIISNKARYNLFFNESHRKITFWGSILLLIIGIPGLILTGSSFKIIIMCLFAGIFLNYVSSKNKYTDKNKRQKILRLLHTFKDIDYISEESIIEKDLIKKFITQINLVERELNLNEINMPGVFDVEILDDKNYLKIEKYLIDHSMKHSLEVFSDDEIEKSYLTQRQLHTALAFLKGLKDKIPLVHFSWYHEIYDFVENYHQFDRVGFEFKDNEKKVLKGLFYIFKKQNNQGWLK